VTVPPSTMAPVIVEPTTTVETIPETVPETVPDTVVIPDGATELGYGVYVPAMAGVEVSGDGPFTFAREDGRQIIAQVLNRDYSEDPNDLLQEYIDTWDADYDNVVYSLSSVFEPGHLSHLNLRLAHVYYSIHQPGQEGNLGGLVWAVVRDDGLSLVLDQWGAGESPFGETYEEVITSLANAPAVGEPHEFAPGRSQVPTNSRPVIDIPFTCNCEVVAAPGYVVTATTATSVTLVHADSQMILQRVDGITSADQAQQLAVQMVQGLAPSATIEQFELTERQLPNYFTNWHDSGGVRAFGSVWMVFDEDAQAVLIAISSTVGTIADPTSPSFMADGFAWQQWTLN
ncbi:MAG: hypothetical protein ABMA25_04755, partial [Ilumatobacteraceae bacterium]